MILPPGKLRIDFLQQILPQSQNEARVIVGPAIGEDATVIDFGETCLVAKTDPITFATEEIGWYLVCVNSNDGSNSKMVVSDHSPARKPHDRGFSSYDDAANHCRGKQIYLIDCLLLSSAGQEVI